jgi:hypothetical protein
MKKNKVAEKNMWWLVAVLLVVVGVSFMSRREGVVPSPDDPSVKQLLSSNERTMEDLIKKVDALAPLAEQVTSLKSRLDQSNKKLDDIALMKRNEAEGK